jgi:hypothetical protein
MKLPEAARPLWARAQDKVPRAWGTKHGLTSKGCWPTCFVSPSRSGGRSGARAVSS